MATTKKTATPTKTVAKAPAKKEKTTTLPAVGDKFVSHRKDRATITVKELRVGPKWVAVLDAKGTQHARFPVKIAK